MRHRVPTLCTHGFVRIFSLLVLLNGIRPLYADTATDLAYAMDVPTNSLVSATFPVLADATAAKVRTNWGVSSPFVGTNFTVLSTGRAAALGMTGYVDPEPGTAFANSGTNPAAGQLTCGGVETANGFDYTALQLTLNVPTNADGFTLKFNFFSAEYPESVCVSYNDRFMILLTSAATNGDIATDSRGNRVSVNTAFFAVTNGGDLTGTGMDIPGNSGLMGAAIGWQTLHSPLLHPGETITLKFLIFDAGDHGNDSVAVIDAFAWHPVTSPAASIYRAVEIGWPSASNRNYQVEYSGNVNAPVWSSLGSVVPGNGSTNYIFDTTRGVNTNRFYRIREMP